MNSHDWATLTGESYVIDVPTGRVGALADGASATVAHVAALDAEIRVLNTDVNARLQNPLATQFITEKWAPFFVAWQGWFAENGTVPTLPIPGVNFNANKNEDFLQFVQAYNENLREFQALGFATAAKRSTAADPPGWFSSVPSLGTIAAVAVGAATVYLALEAYRASR
jgi:hypothetical protein